MHENRGAPRSAPSILSLLTVLTLLLLGCIHANKPPGELLCVNTECTGVISSATTLTHYQSPDKFFLSFKPNSKVRVLAKPKDPKGEHWGVELNGLYGFVPRKLLRESGIHAQPKQNVDIKDYINIIKLLNSDNKKTQTTELKNDAESENEDSEDDPDEEVMNDPTKPPSHRIKKQDQYYKDKMYLEKKKKNRKHYTENLEIRSSTVEPIVSSALPDVVTNAEDISATQSIMIFDGTTIYPDSNNTVHSIDNEKEKSLTSAQKPVPIHGPTNNNDNIKIDPYSSSNKIVDAPEIDKELLENNLNENIKVTTHPATDKIIDVAPEPITESLENNINEDTERSLYSLRDKNFDVATESVEEPLDKNVNENVKMTPYSFTEKNVDFASETKESPESDENEDEVSSSGFEENSFEEDSDESIETVDSDEISQANIDQNENSDTHLINTSSETLNDQISNSSSENINDEPSNLSSEHVANNESKTLTENSFEPSSTADIISNQAVENPSKGFDSGANEKYNSQSNIVNSDITDKFYDNKTAVTEDSNSSDEIKYVVDALDKQNNSVELISHDNLQNNLNDHNIDSDIKTQNEVKNDFGSLNYVVHGSENSSNSKSELNNVSEVREKNEIIETLQINSENSYNIQPENSTNDETPNTLLTPTEDINKEESTTEFFDSHYIQNEATTVEYNDYTNNYDPQLPLDIDSTTVNNILDQSQKEETKTSYVDSEEDKGSFNYEESLSDTTQQSNLLDSYIESETSFFSSPLTLFTNVYKSISNIIKSNGISNTIEKANTNIFNSEEIKSNDYQQFENNGHSQQYISMFTDSSQCSVEEKSMPSITDISTDFIFWLVVSAISVLMFTLGYYYLENRKQDGKLLAMVNSLQKELLCSSKECILLKEELTVTKEKLMGIEDSSFGSNEMVVCLKKELSDNQQTISELHEKLISTEEELANSTEAALELQSILDEQLSAKDTSSSSLAFTITNLQSQLDDQQTTMNLTKAQLTAKMEENELLILKIMDANEKCSSIDKQLLNTQDSLKQAVEENESKSQQLQELASNLEKSLLQAETQRKSEVKELQLQIKDLKDELNNTKASLKARNQELQTLQENVKTLQFDEKNISAILNDSHTKGELIKITAEKKILNEKLEAENAQINELNKKNDEQTLRISEMIEKLSEADQKTLEASTRLEVLTNYFNQKEADLLKELSTKEALWMSQRGEAMSTVEKIQSLQQEIQLHKDTTESIRREVVEQEAAWRAKVAALEQRAHEHWLARRAAERSAEASAREAQTLRQRLAAPSPDKRVVSPLTTGESITDPTFLPPLGMLPPPPLGFLPPPLGGPMLLPPPLPPHRPPPLGRLSSPPPLQSMRPDRSFSPDSRYSPERAYSPQQRGRSPFSNSESRRRPYNNNRRYDNRYYDSEEDRRSRRYETETDFSPVNTLPPSPTPNSRNHKGVSSGSGHSYDSLEKYK